MKRTSAFATFAAVCALSAASAVAAPPDDLKALLDQGKTAEAYALGKAHPELLGEPAFDFYFGIAAIDAGHAGEGSLALERYLLNFPDNNSARLQLARGYFTMGDDGRAREEFEALQKTNPAPDVAAGIQRFLDAIRLRASSYAFTAGGYVEIGGGTDSNVNAAPGSGSVSLPVIGPVDLAPNSRRLGDSFSSVGAGGYASYPVLPGIALFATGQAEQRFNDQQKASQFDLGSFNGSAGASLLSGDNLYRVAVNYANLQVGSSKFRDSTGYQAEWQHQLDSAQIVSMGVQTARYKYGRTTTDDGAGNITISDNSARNADFTGVTGGYRRTLRLRMDPVVNLSLNMGSQDSRTGRDDLVPRTYGGSLGVSLTPAEKWGVQLGRTYLRSEYRAADFFAQPESRHDRYDATSASVAYLLTRSLSVRAEALWSKNHSNADAYVFSRDVYTVKLRYEFK